MSQEAPPVVEAASAPRGLASRMTLSRWKFVFVGLLIVGVLGTATWVLLGSRLLVVRKIVVVGNHMVSRDQVLGVARIRLGEPLIKLNTGTVGDRVEAVQEVETARVERGWPTTVRIVIKERTPIVAVLVGVAGRSQGGETQNNRYLEIDRFGVTVISVPTRPTGLPLLTVASPVQADPTLHAGLAVWRELPSWLAGRVGAIRAPNAESITLQLRDGMTIVWGAPERAAEKVRLLRGLLLDSPPRGAKMIDVSSPEVVTTQ
jgi:cell division protein FtsQ